MPCITHPTTMIGSLKSMRPHMAKLALVTAALIGASLIQHTLIFADDTAIHPMDPLTAAEYSTVVSTLRKANHVDDASRYPLIALHEPAKQLDRWVGGQCIHEMNYEF